MHWNGKAFVTKATLRYACPSPIGFELMYLKAQSSLWGKGGEVYFGLEDSNIFGVSSLQKSSKALGYVLCCTA